MKDGVLFRKNVCEKILYYFRYCININEKNFKWVKYEYYTKIIRNLRRLKRKLNF